jgi:hypothetical protein
MVVALGVGPEDRSGMLLGAESLAGARDPLWRAGGLGGVIEDLGAKGQA